MAARVFGQSLVVGGRSFLAAVSRSYTSPSSVFRNRYLFRLRPFVAVSPEAYFRRVSPIRGFATRSTSSSLNDPNPNWSNRPPKETILLDGCDFEHWLVVMEKPEGDPTRDEIIDSYIKKLAEVVGSEEEARKKIYSVSTRHYYAFGALVSEELSYKLKELDKVRWVLPDSYLDVKNKDYGGEPFIDGQAVPYHPKYHEEWVRNNARANERNRRNDRPRQFDRSRNFERRRDPQMNQNFGGNNMAGQPNAPPPGPVQPNLSGNAGHPGNVNMSQPPAPSPGTTQPNMGGHPNYVPSMPSPGNTPYPGPTQANMGGYPPNSGPGGFPPNNAGYVNGPQNEAGGGPRYPQPPGPGGFDPQSRPSQGYVNGPQNEAGGGPRYPQPPGPGGFDPQGRPSQGYYQNPNVAPPNANGFSQPPYPPPPGPGGFDRRGGPSQGQHPNPHVGPGQGYSSPAPNMGQSQVHNPYQGHGPNAPNGYQPPAYDQNAPHRVHNVPTRD